MAIGAGLILKSTKNLVVKIVDIIKIIANGLLDALDASINIPVLSSIYKTISGYDLNFLDLICLIGAIPITVIFKIITNEMPFPDDSLTQSLIDAPDFTSLRKLLSPPNNKAFSTQGCSPQKECWYTSRSGCVRSCKLIANREGQRGPQHRFATWQHTCSVFCMSQKSVFGICHTTCTTCPTCTCP
jgi:hypothetical protein